MLGVMFIWCKGFGRMLFLNFVILIVVKDEEFGICLIIEVNYEWVDEYERLLCEYEELKVYSYDIENKYYEVQKENVKIKRYLELFMEKYN